MGFGVLSVCSTICFACMQQGIEWQRGDHCRTCLDQPAFNLGDGQCPSRASLIGIAISCFSN
jgi:hypothetical protein